MFTGARNESHGSGVRARACFTANQIYPVALWDENTRRSRHWGAAAATGFPGPPPGGRVVGDVRGARADQFMTSSCMGADLRIRWISPVEGGAKLV